MSVSNRVFVGWVGNGRDECSGLMEIVEGFAVGGVNAIEAAGCD